MARILVTGACGFVGPSVANLGIQLGHEVFATDFSDRYQKFLNPKANLKLGLDIRNPLTIAKYIEEVQPDILFHVAAYFRYHGPWQTYYSINVEGTQNVLESALKVKSIKSVIVWSSGSVLGHHFKGERFLNEQEPTDPRSFYEESKLLAEQKALSYKDRLPVVVIRPAAIYGSGIEYGGPAGTYGALKVIQMMFKNQLHAIPGRGQNRFTFIHVEDIARVAYFLAEQKEAIGEIYNVADQSNYTLSELMVYIAAWLRERNIPINFTPKLHFYVPVIYMIGFWCEMLAKLQKREPTVERPFLNFFRTGYNFSMSNKKLDALIQKKTQEPIIKYRDIIKDGALDHNLEWYRKELLCS